MRTIPCSSAAATDAVLHRTPGSRRRRGIVFGPLLLLLAACAPGSGGAAAPGSSPADFAKRHRLVPRVDHHQHMMSEQAAIPIRASLPDAVLPPELERVMERRNERVAAAGLGELYAPDAQVLSLLEGERWTRDRAEVEQMVGAFRPGTRFVANQYSIGDSAGYIAGVIRPATSQEDKLNFVLGLKRGVDGSWQIVSEATSTIAPPELSRPFTADDVIEDLDEAGIERAVVLSVAYWFGEPGELSVAEEYEKVRAENDWVRAEVARFPERLVAFCSFNPLRPYAVEELERCSKLGMTGLKMHFGSSDVDVKNPEHLAAVRAVFQAADDRRLPIVVHLRGDQSYGREHAEIFLNEILPAAPSITVQIAHFSGGGAYSDHAADVLAAAVAAGDPRTRNLYFDLTEIERTVSGPDELARVAERIRQVGPERVLYGSDMPATTESPPPAVAWATLRARLPLSYEEMKIIADNVAPYLR